MGALTLQEIYRFFIKIIQHGIEKNLVHMGGGRGWGLNPTLPQIRHRMSRDVPNWKADRVKKL